jgi:hypothetical protein
LYSDNPKKFPAATETWQSPLVSSNDIFINVHRRPQFNQNTRVMDWGIYQSESPSILDLLRKLQDVTSVPRKLASNPRYGVGTGTCDFAR